MNLDKAITVVKKKGNPLDQLRLRCARGEPFTPDEAEKTLAPYQFPDGSWDYNPKEENRIGSLGGTIHCLRWLREFGLGKRLQMAHTLEFLASIQEADGSFYETEAKLAHSPQEWLQKETMIDRFYFTAAVPMRLFSLGYRYHPVVEPALKWLNLVWHDWELITGTWYNLWALLCLYPADVGINTSLYDRCHTKALEWFPHLSAQSLTWLLDALLGAGYSAKDLLIKKGIAHLHLQNKDGIWVTPHSTVETTVTAVKLFRQFKSASTL